MSPPTPPGGYSARALTTGDVWAVAEPIAACELADFGRAEMTVEELRGDWQEIEPSEEAVVVTAPGGSVAAASTTGHPDSTAEPGCTLRRATRSTRRSCARDVSMADGV